jgi:LysR family transcriptional activator of nhaA
MEWLNYHHLLYFWTVAREGGVARAAGKLGLAQPTVSAQVNALEDALGERLFDKQGRGLALTEVGRTVYQYADEIFALGRELLDTVKDRPTGRQGRLSVGVSDVVPKLVASRVIAPALAMKSPPRVFCREGKPDRLFADLAVHGLDLVLTDAPVPPGLRVKVFTCQVAESGVTFFAAKGVASKLAGRFPRLLDGAPMLLPSDTSALRRPLEQWLDARGLRPTVVAEFDDSALMKTFGESGAGVFAAPSMIEKEVRRQYEVAVVGRTTEVRERFYAVLAERKVTNAAVKEILRGSDPEFSLFSKADPFSAPEKRVSFRKK